ncbi:MAG TPA: hypothetical protein PKA37_13200, partial [Planctomycetota bacterium]|nr:hypothetical protein [Planctomycetota bacterium]
MPPLNAASRFLRVLALVLLTTGILMAQDPVESRIAFLDQWCLDCPQGAAAKGGFRTEQLKDRPLADSDLALWLHV